MEGNLEASAPGKQPVVLVLSGSVTERSHVVQASGDPLLSSQVSRAHDK